jgi:hypothetical protein
MKKLLLFLIVGVLLSPSLYAIPNLQLIIDDAEYIGGEEESWVYYGGGTFDLYVVGANVEMTDVRVSMALIGLDQADDPTGASIDVDGTSYPTGAWAYGYSPLEADLTKQPGDLAPHGVFPAWFTEFNAGDFGLDGLVGQTNPDSASASDPFWTPWGATPGTKAGEWKKFSITVAEGYFVHFDAYTLNPDGSIKYFAPFSHDAATNIPEPTTFVLLGLGLAGAGVVRKVRGKAAK